ncbi:hypothetical protein B0H14DRAFT_269855 [Mycena olivaceomarginata]|nr:hypothetical protein B0H14DRAFT_269855 [Mycena olivaceomarginata]
MAARQHVWLIDFEHVGAFPLPFRTIALYNNGNAFTAAVGTFLGVERGGERWRDADEYGVCRELAENVWGRDAWTQRGPVGGRCALDQRGNGRLLSGGDEGKMSGFQNPAPSSGSPLALHPTGEFSNDLDTLYARYAYPLTRTLDFSGNTYMCKDFVRCGYGGFRCNIMPDPLSILAVRFAGGAVIRRRVDPHRVGAQVPYLHRAQSYPHKSISPYPPRAHHTQEGCK